MFSSICMFSLYMGALTSCKNSYLSFKGCLESTAFSLPCSKGYFEDFIMIFPFFFHFLRRRPATCSSFHMGVLPISSADRGEEKLLCKESIYFTNVKLFLRDHLDLYDCVFPCTAESVNLIWLKCADAVVSVSILPLNMFRK